MKLPRHFGAVRVVVHPGNGTVACLPHFILVIPTQTATTVELLDRAESWEDPESILAGLQEFAEQEDVDFAALFPEKNNITVFLSGSMDAVETAGADLTYRRNTEGVRILTLTDQFESLGLIAHGTDPAPPDRNYGLDKGVVPGSALTLLRTGDAPEEEEIDLPATEIAEEDAPAAEISSPAAVQHDIPEAAAQLDEDQSPVQEFASSLELEKNRAFIAEPEEEEPSAPSASHSDPFPHFATPEVSEPPAQVSEPPARNFVLSSAPEPALPSFGEKEEAPSIDLSKAGKADVPEELPQEIAAAVSAPDIDPLGEDDPMPTLIVPAVTSNDQVPQLEKRSTSLPGPVAQPLQGSSKAFEEIEENKTEIPVVMTDGLYCARGDFNHPDAQTCAYCGLDLTRAPRNLVRGPRPPLGVIVLDDGTTFTVDDNYILGRDPSNDPDVKAGTHRPLPLDDPEQHLSRIHAEIRLEGWNTLLTDRKSANGTYISYPNAPGWTLIPPGTTAKLTSGVHVLVGHRQFEYNGHHEHSGTSAKRF